jgi:hypothetical protein
MAALRKSSLFNWSEDPNRGKTQSRVAHDYTLKVYKETGGATPALKRVYRSFLENERRRSELVGKDKPSDS